MKKSIILMSAVGLLAAGCTKEAIDLAPKNTISYDVAFETPALCELTIIGCYDAAQSGYYPGNDQRRGYPFGAATVQQGDMKGEDMLNLQQFFLVTYAGDYNTSAPNGQAHWECTYQMINKINIVIEGLDQALENGVISQKKHDDAVGELRFLRALGFHEMLIYFSMPYAATPDASHMGIPVSITPINTIEKVEEAKSAGRATVKATYDQILDDLKFAEENLPSVSSDLAASAVAAGDAKSWRNSTNLISRASKAAAIALKARVYQHMGQWDNVVTESAKLVSATAPFTSAIGTRSLTAEPEGPFANNSSNSESIFSIENSATDNCTNNGSLAQFYHTVRSLVGTSPIIINADFWLADDKRRTQLIRVADYGSVDIHWSWKYRSGTAMTDWTPIIRYAEVLLTYAEAVARTKGVDAQAVALLNAVRNRAVTDASKHFTVASFANVDELMTAIMNERRIEFLAEGRRWPDIHRLTYDKYAVKSADGKAGVPDKVLFGAMHTKDDETGEYLPDKPSHYQPASGIVDPEILETKGFNYEDRRYVFPIPQSETSSNPTMAGQQNPGW